MIGYLIEKFHKIEKKRKEGDENYKIMGIYEGKGQKGNDIYFKDFGIRDYYYKWPFIVRK